MKNLINFPNQPTFRSSMLASASILALFSMGEEGVLFDFSPENLFQDVNATIPVLSPADPVGLALDTSKGVKSKRTLGPELALDDNWTVGDGWTFSDGTATRDDTTPASNFSQSVFTAGKDYRVSWEQSGGFVAVYYDGLTSLASNEDGSERYSMIIKSVNGGNITFRANNEVSVRRVSVREYTQSFEGLGAELIANDLTTTFDDRAEITATTDSLVFNTTTADQISSYFVGGELDAFYLVSFEIYDVVSGGINLRFGGGGTNDASNLTAGVYSFILPLDGPGLSLRTSAVVTELKIRNISVRPLPGNHATQATAAKRPAYGIVPATGRRNLLPSNTDLSSDDWIRGLQNSANAPVVTLNQAIAPDGTMTAARVQFSTIGTSSIDRCRLISTLTLEEAGTFTSSFWLKSATGSPQPLSTNLSNGNLEAITVTDEWQKFTNTHTPGNDILNLVELRLSGNQALSSDVYVWLPQLDRGSIATDTQKVVSDLEVTEEGVPSLDFLRFDGVDDFMATPTITPGTDKAQIFAGVQKFTDVTGTVLGTNATGADLGSILLQAPRASGANFAFQVGGSNVGSVSTLGGFPAPVTAVVSALADIPEDVNTFKVNTTGALISLDQGTGNFLAYPLYIGSRGGSLLFFNGNLYSMITRFGPNLDAAQIASTESYTAKKTPEVTL